MGSWVVLIARSQDLARSLGRVHAWPKQAAPSIMMTVVDGGDDGDGGAGRKVPVKQYRASWMLGARFSPKRGKGSARCYLAVGGCARTVSGVRTGSPALVLR